MEGGFRTTGGMDGSLTTYRDELFQPAEVKDWFADRQGNNILGRGIVHRNQHDLLRIESNTVRRDILLV